MTAKDITERAALWAAYTTAKPIYEYTAPRAELESAMMLARIRQQNIAPTPLVVEETRN